MSATPAEFRWQAFFQRSRDPLFLLNADSRILFVNTAWETLVGLPLADVRGRPCRRSRPVGVEVGDPDKRERKILAHALTPPPEVLAGRAATTRRMLPGWPIERRWWEVEFLPLLDSTGQLLAVLGRVRPLGADPARLPLNLPERLIALRESVLRRPSLDWFGQSTPRLRRLGEQVRLAASVRVPVLLVGEAGTGKQTLARIIHHLGPARERSLAVLDCQRMPVTVLADLLFGPAGLKAHGVETVYLREPGRLPGEIQARIVESISTSFPRVLAGCQTPDSMTEALACALGSLTIPVPPLRQRSAEIPRLIEACLERLAERDGKLVVEVLPEALALLRDHPWPGNVRELLDVLSTARDRTTTEAIAAEHLPLAVRLPQTLQRTAHPASDKPMPLEQLLEQAERRLIELALERTGGHKTRAAEMLGIWRQRLVRRMVALGIADADTVPASEIEIEPE